MPCEPCKRSSRGVSGESTGEENYAACVPYPIRVDRQTARTYMERVGTNPDGKCLVTACVMVGRLIYFKKTPGDCGTQTSIDLGALGGVNKGLRFAGAASSAVAGGAGLFASGGSLALGATAAASVVGLALLPISVLFGISAHHAKAVAREQATLCDVAVAYNTFADALEGGILNRQVGLDDAIASAKQVERVLLDEAQRIAKSCNAACEMQYAIKAVTLYATEVYYQSLKSGILGTGVSGKAAGLAAGIAAGAAVVA